MARKNEWIIESKIDLSKRALSGDFCSIKSCVKGSYCKLVEMADESGFSILEPGTAKPLKYRFLEVSPLSHTNQARRNYVLMVKLADENHTYKEYCKGKKNGGNWRIFNTKTGVVLDEQVKRILPFPLQFKRSLAEANKTFSYFGDNFSGLKEYTIKEYDKIYTRVVAGFNCFFVELADQSGYTLLNAETCRLSDARFAGVKYSNKGVVQYIFPVPKENEPNRWTYSTPIGTIANLSLTRKEVENICYELLDLLPSNPNETPRITRGVKHARGAFESLSYADAIVENYKNTCNCSTVNDGVLKQQLQNSLFTPYKNTDKMFLNDYRIKTENSNNQELSNLNIILTQLAQQEN